jgi:beta-lactamase regulating signal transducer with metallopeptidase domain
MNVFGWPESWFLQLAGQTFVCLALGLWIATRLARSPARAHIVIVLALSAALLAPLASWLLKELNLGLFLASPAPTSYLLQDETKSGPTRSGVTAIWSVPNSLWSAGSLTMLLGIAVSYIRGRRLVAKAQPVTDSCLLAALAAARSVLGLRAKPDLRSDAGVPSPMIWAWGPNPVALIPDDAIDQTESTDWELIFIHELAHVRRRDHWAAVFADIAVALYFWNPVVWWARQRLSRESEFACDDCVANSGKSAVEFAQALLALRREALMPRIPAAYLAGSGSWLKARVNRLLQTNQQPAASFGRAWLTGALSVACTVVLALALVQTRQAPRPEDSFARPLTATVDQSSVQVP